MLEGQRVDAEMVLEILGRESAMVLTALRGGDLVACCELAYRSDSNDVYLGMFAVRPALQDSGVGRQVLDEAERISVEKWSIDRVVITVIEVRQELISWYERRGFVRTGATGEFPYGDDRFGLPLRSDLRFVELAKPMKAIN